MSGRSVRVGDVLRLERRPVTIDSMIEYVAIGVRSFGKGVFYYPPCLGSDLSKLRFFEVHSGALLVSNIKAWEGAIAVSSEADEGTVASNRFLSYFPIDNKIDVRYAHYLLLSQVGLPLIERASPGSADRNRTLSIDRFENVELAVHDLDEQPRVADYIDQLLTDARGIARQLGSGGSADRIVSLYPGLVEQRLGQEALHNRPVQEIADFVNDLVRPGEATGPAEAFVGLQHVESHTGRRIGELPLGGEKGRKFRFQPGDVVYGYLRPYLNKVWVADMHGLCSVDQYVLRPKNGVTAHYLAHALRSRATLDRAIAMTHSLQLPRLRSGLLSKINVPIVDSARIDEVTAVLDRLLAKVVEAPDGR